MYIEDFEAFYKQAEELFRTKPLDTRYNVKYRHCDGKLVLKVTDDIVCLKYKTDQQTDLKKLERMNNLALLIATKGETAQVEELQPAQGSQQASAPAAAGSKKSRRKG